MLSLIFSLLSVCFFSSWGCFVLYLLVVCFLFSISSFEYSIFKVNALIELDAVSNSMIMLSFWVVILCYLGSLKVCNFKIMQNQFSFLLKTMLLFLMFCFSFSNYILFFFSFECSLIPVLFLILGWGYQPERTQAGYYLMFYTLTASLPLLVFILNMNLTESLTMCLNFYNSSVYGYLNVFMLLAFLVKFPMYMVHLWLPKAHVEAPVAGSMILAGVLLKLGGYGMIRFLPLTFFFPKMLQSFLVCFSVWGGFVISLNCLSLMDMKSLVAYSSVVHMSTCISVLLIMNDWGLKSAVMMMVAHGLCSSGLFFLIGSVYERSYSRSLTINKGLLNLMPSMGLWWFLLLSANMAAPPTINLLSEIGLISSLLSWSSLLMFPVLLLTFFSGAYSLYLFSLSQHGKFLFSKQGFFCSTVVEYFIVFMHWAPLNLLILAPCFIIYF